MLKKRTHLDELSSQKLLSIMLKRKLSFLELVKGDANEF